MNFVISHFALLTAAASVSPLLTFARLWQIKEWRIDRLREHMRNEGTFRQLFGTLRPLIIGAAVLVGPFLPLEKDQWTLMVLIALTGMSLMQFLVRKQLKPVWTKKACVLIATTLLLTYILASTYSHPYSYLFLPILQPFLLAVAWLIWQPVDQYLKRRIMNRTRTLRKAHTNLTVIGITGSVGKTTTKEILAHILSEKNPLVTPAHVNTEMGVSQWLAHKLSKKNNSDEEIVVVEMGAYRKGEISLLSSIVQPTIGIITFIGSQHIGLFGSQEALCEAKGELLQALPEDGHAFLNADSSLCLKLKDACPCTTTTVGTGGISDVEAFDIEETQNGICFRADDTKFTLPLHGTHNVTNVLLAIAASKHIGMTSEDIAQKLRTFSPPKHTFTVQTHGDITILDDTHNASPESFKAGIAWARTQPAERKILLTSGLIELGETQDRVHMEIGALAAEVFDVVHCLSDRSAPALARGYGKAIAPLSQEPLTPGTLLVCVGCINPAIIKRLLP